VVQVPPLRPANEEVITQEDHARDCPNTLCIIHTLYDMENKALHDGDSVEYFQDFLRRMHDEICMTCTYQLSKRH